MPQSSPILSTESHGTYEDAIMSEKWMTMRKRKELSSFSANTHLTSIDPSQPDSPSIQKSSKRTSPSPPPSSRQRSRSPSQVMEGCQNQELSVSLSNRFGILPQEDDNTYPSSS